MDADRRASYSDPVIFKVIVRLLTQWRYGPDVRWWEQYALISLNSKIRIQVTYNARTGNVIVWLVKQHESPKRNPLEVIWACEIANPRCFDKLRSFLHDLPDALAKVDQSYAVIP